MIFEEHGAGDADLDDLAVHRHDPDLTAVLRVRVTGGGTHLAGRGTHERTAALHQRVDGETFAQVLGRDESGAAVVAAGERVVVGRRQRESVELGGLVADDVVGESAVFVGLVELAVFLAAGGVPGGASGDLVGGERGAGGVDAVGAGDAGGRCRAVAGRAARVSRASTCDRDDAEESRDDEGAERRGRDA